MLQIEVPNTSNWIIFVGGSICYVQTFSSIDDLLTLQILINHVVHMWSCGVRRHMTLVGPVNVNT
jgi:hypothetical protein